MSSSNTIKTGPISIKGARIKPSEEERKNLLEEVLKTPQGQERINMVKKQSYEQGFAEGRNHGQSETKEEFKTLVLSFQQLVERWENEKKAISDSLEEPILRFIRLAIRKILSLEVEKNTSFLEEWIAPLIKQLPERVCAQVYLAPEDYTLLEKWIQENNTFMEEKIKFSSIEGIARGGFKIVSDLGNINGTLDERLQSLEEIYQEDQGT